MFNNYIFGFLIVVLASYIIQNIYSISKLFKIFYNAIKAYMSLYIDWKILYKDISKNNIILVNPKIADSFIGMLINKNFVKNIDSRKNNTWHWISIIEFMAI